LGYGPATSAVICRRAVFKWNSAIVHSSDAEWSYLRPAPPPPPRHAQAWV
jgi:hypothetical protein